MGYSAVTMTTARARAEKEAKDAAQQTAEAQAKAEACNAKKAAKGK